MPTIQTEGVLIVIVIEKLESDALNGVAYKNHLFLVRVTSTSGILSNEGNMHGFPCWWEKKTSIPGMVHKHLNVK